MALRIVDRFRVNRSAWLTPLLVLALAAPVLAGPPLVCHGFDIGSARSLPWQTGNGWDGKVSAYDTTRLVDDTTALLTPTTPVVVRMETLRRAAIYAERDPALTARLLQQMLDRGRMAPKAHGDPLASFDAGYLVETYRQLALVSKERGAGIRALVDDIDGYGMIARRLTGQPSDPALQFAAAVVAFERDRNGYTGLLKSARSAAERDQLVARNIDRLPTAAAAR
jgi:hypothetical protein